MKIYLVWQFVEQVDSVWDNEEAANKRLKELPDYPEFGYIEAYELNKSGGSE